MQQRKATASHVIFTAYREAGNRCEPVGKVEGNVASPKDFNRLERMAHKRFGSKCDHVSHVFYPANAAAA